MAHFVGDIDNIDSFLLNGVANIPNNPKTPVYVIECLDLRNWTAEFTR